MQRFTNKVFILLYYYYFTFHKELISSLKTLFCFSHTHLFLQLTIKSLDVGLCLLRVNCKSRTFVERASLCIFKSLYDSQALQRLVSNLFIFYSQKSSFFLNTAICLFNVASKFSFILSISQQVVFLACKAVLYFISSSLFQTLSSSIFFYKNLTISVCKFAKSALFCIECEKQVLYALPLRSRLSQRDPILKDSQSLPLMRLEPMELSDWQFGNLLQDSPLTQVLTTLYDCFYLALFQQFFYLISFYNLLTFSLSSSFSLTNTGILLSNF